jgi:tetratricopeptide (TPR) repeat protein
MRSPAAPLRTPLSAALLALLVLCGPARGGAAAQPLEGAAYRHAAAAYEAIARGDLPLAEREARLARGLAPRSADAARLLADVLARAGRDREAWSVADDALSAGIADPGLSAQRGYLSARFGDTDAAIGDFRTALAAPGLAPERGRELRLALADQALAAGRREEALAALAPHEGEQAYDVAARRGFALHGLRRFDEASRAFRTAAAAASSPEDRRTAIKGIAQSEAELGDEGEVRHLVEEAAALDGACDLDLVYLLIRIHEDGHALDMADRRCEGDLPLGAELDLGYAAKRAFRNEAAVGHFARALEADALPGQAPADPRTVFGIRREIETLEREWGLAASLFSVAGRSDGGGGDTAQAIVEGYWQPPGIGYRDGRVLQLYARASTAAPVLPGAVADDGAQGALGIRYKPLPTQNLVLAGERLTPIGSEGMADWLARIGYSGGFGTGLEPVEHGWLFEQHYAEADYFVEQGRLLLTGEARLGVSRRLGGSANLVGSAWLGGAFSYDDAERHRLSAGFGPGVSLRYWFRETALRAPASHVQIDLGYRAAVTESDRMGGFLLTIGSQF